jgi:hypothetical protein
MSSLLDPSQNNQEHIDRALSAAFRLLNRSEASAVRNGEVPESEPEPCESEESK